MAIALIKTGKKSNLAEARDLIDWCRKIYEATTDNNISWHAGKDYNPTIYDELGPGAVQSIDSLFTQDQHPISPLPDKIEKRWNRQRSTGMK